MQVLGMKDFRAKAGSKRLPVGEVEVPALGGKVFLCKHSAGERDWIQRALLSDGPEASYYRARIVIATTVDADGSKVFARTDEAWLSDLEWDVLDPIVNKSNQLNSTLNIEDLEKNSETSPTSNSDTGSP